MKKVSTFALLVIALVWAMPGWARVFPGKTVTAQFQLKTDQLAVLDEGIILSGTQKKMSVGSTIRDENNRVLLPYIVVGRPAQKAKISFDNYGDIQRVWFLTPEEIAALPK